MFLVLSNPVPRCPADPGRSHTPRRPPQRLRSGGHKRCHRCSAPGHQSQLCCHKRLAGPKSRGRASTNTTTPGPDWSTARPVASFFWFARGVRWLLWLVLPSSVRVGGVCVKSRWRWLLARGRCMGLGGGGERGGVGGWLSVCLLVQEPVGGGKGGGARLVLGRPPFFAVVAG